MYKYTDNTQSNFLDFNQPIGLHMNPENRWVKMADAIPWEIFEKKYSRLFKGKNGRVAKPLRLALGSLIIQTKYQYSDRELVEQLTENPYYQYFIGLPGYQEEPPIDASTLVLFRKRLKMDIILEANEYMLDAVKEKQSSDKKDDDHTNPPSGGGCDGQDTKQELASEEGKIKYNYNRDLVFALKIYEFFSVGQYNMPPRIAADPRVWSYISIRLVPEIVRERWPKKSSWEDRFYRKPNRIYLKVLWWYIYLSWQGETEDTRIILENNTEDTIAQLVERSGAHGYRLELYRKIMRRFFMMDDRRRLTEDLIQAI